eukprot:933234-Lingulodinium_polyedra.AAC.1
MCEEGPCTILACALLSQRYCTQASGALAEIKKIVFFPTITLAATATCQQCTDPFVNSTRIDRQRVAYAMTTIGEAAE